MRKHPKQGVPSSPRRRRLGASGFHRRDRYERRPSRDAQYRRGGNIPLRARGTLYGGSFARTRTTILYGGIFGASFSVISRLTSNVLRLRLLMPIRRQSSSSARSS